MEVDAVIVANLLHVSPPGAIGALCAGTAGVLRDGGLLQVYGPFNRQGRYTSEGNAAFDHSLRQQNPEWGIRDLEALQSAGDAHGLTTVEIVEMPANNLVVVMRNLWRATAPGG
jgi:hypothetical protein